ncbi:hypothetical protein FRC06_008072 [Ceratobasidium sp. 370]|nr:hypothetical protein FRC06_008072 [Ceratobasidium sp. 370]
MTTIIFTPQPPAEPIHHTATTFAFDHRQVCHASQEPLSDTMTASSPYTAPAVKPPVLHSNPKHSLNVAEPEEHPALLQSETLPPPSLVGGHEPPPVPTTPPPESPKNQCAHLVPSLELVGRGSGFVQDDVCVDLAGEHEPPPVPTTPPPESPKNRCAHLVPVGRESDFVQDDVCVGLAGEHEPPPVPTTPPPPPPQERSTHDIVHSVECFDLGLGVDVTSADSTRKHEPPPVPHTPPPPPPKGRGTRGAAESSMPCAVVHGNGAPCVSLAGKHEPPPPPITPPPSPPKNKSMHHALHGNSESTAVFNAGVFTQLMLTILPEVAFVSGVVMDSHNGTHSIVDTIFPTVPCVSVLV